MKIELAKTETIHFVGIGGIGMSGLANIMRGLGFKVQGSDINLNKNIERLKGNKIKVYREIENLPNDFKKISVLINNAGLAWGFETAQDVDIEKWETMIDTNCKGLVYMTKAVLPGLIKRNKGHIINLGSVFSKSLFEILSNNSPAEISDCIFFDLLIDLITIFWNARTLFSQ